MQGVQIMELAIFWLMTGAFICRASYIAEKRPVWRCYNDIIVSFRIRDRKELMIGLATLAVFVLLWPLTLYYFVMDDSDW